MPSSTTNVRKRANDLAQLIDKMPREPWLTMVGGIANGMSESDAYDLWSQIFVKLSAQLDLPASGVCASKSSGSVAGHVQGNDAAENDSPGVMAAVRKWGLDFWNRAKEV